VSWSRSNFSWGTFLYKRPNVTLAANSEFDQPSMIALASSRSVDVAAPVVERLPTIQELIGPVNTTALIAGHCHGSSRAMTGGTPQVALISTAQHGRGQKRLASRAVLTSGVNLCGSEPCGGARRRNSARPQHSQFASAPARPRWYQR
jgi:hypothetical protein